MPDSKVLAKQDSNTYQGKKPFFDNLLTIYGRKPVLEALGQGDIMPHCLHLANRNRPGATMTAILRQAEKRGLTIRYHARAELAYISKNRRQDQGVALDIALPQYQPSHILQPVAGMDLVALENVTNPQNLGMIIRSVGASPCRGLILPKQGNARIDALVIKASAGTALKVPIFHCGAALEGISALKQKGFKIIGLSSGGAYRLSQLNKQAANIFVLGNETHGLSQAMIELCAETLSIPLSHQVESLNVCVAASLVAFRKMF